MIFEGFRWFWVFFEKINFWTEISCLIRIFLESKNVVLLSLESSYQRIFFYSENLKDSSQNISGYWKVFQWFKGPRSALYGRKYLVKVDSAGLIKRVLAHQKNIKNNFFGRGQSIFFDREDFFSKCLWFYTPHRDKWI